MTPSEALVQAIIQAESAGNPNAVSPAGAIGLMQIMPATFKEWAAKVGIKDADPLNSCHNVTVGTAYIGWLLDQFHGKRALALAAYNWGIGNVQKALQGGDSFFELYSKLPLETRKYVFRVLGFLLGEELCSSR